jgi:protein-tyrosine phosphatase
MKLILIFTCLLNLGFIEPMNESNDDREMYYIYLSDGNVIEHAYKEEVLEWIETGTFEYNEDLTINTLYNAD